MSKKEMHEYFGRISSEWNIIDFLKICDLEPYRKKIEKYLSSLETIVNMEKGQRCENAQKLINNYRQGSKPDKKKAKEWNNERLHKQVHIHQSTITTEIKEINRNMGNITTTGGTFIASSSIPKRDHAEDYEEQRQTKRAKKLSSGKGGDILPNGIKVEKPAPINLIPSEDDDSFQDNDNSSQDDDSFQDDDDSSQIDDYNYDYNSDDDEDIPAPDESQETLDSILSNKKTWTLPSGEDFNDIVAKKISANAKAIKKKKRLSAVEKAILRYGASQIIDLSAHMKQWFMIEDRKFIMKDYKALLQVSEMPDEECSFVKIIEDMVHKGKVDEAYKFCMKKHLSSEKNSYIYKISKIYADFIYKSKDQADILDYNTKNIHTETDVILKACAYIIEGLNKNLQIYPRWGESFCPLSRSIDHIRGRKCDVRFLLMSGVDVGEWEFSANTTASKTIGDRCRSARINQSILNGLLEYKLNDEQVKDIQVPFIQFAGTSGQMLIEDLVKGFYIVFPGPKFELPTKLQNIGKLKTTINVIKSVMDMYKKTCEVIENLETTHHEFDDIFDDLDTAKTTTHFKSKQVHKPWWTPKSKKA